MLNLRERQKRPRVSEAFASRAPGVSEKPATRSKKQNALRIENKRKVVATELRKPIALIQPDSAQPESMQTDSVQPESRAIPAEALHQIEFARSWTVPGATTGWEDMW